METSELKVVRVDGQVYMVPGRALSLSPPWHYLMLNVPPPGRKDIENRTPGFTSIKFRGWCWVHATATCAIADYEAATAAAYDRLVLPCQWPSYHVFKREEEFDGVRVNRGGMVGAFKVDGYLAPTQFPQHKWHFPNHHGFPVSNATPVPFVPCPGKLGFWRVEYEHLCTLVRECIRAGVKLPFIKAAGEQVHA